jgi:GNAT superfamily N-acetyltransferase
MFIRPAKTTDSNDMALTYRKQIRSMYVDPDWQRQKIGSLLFEVLAESELKMWHHHWNTVRCHM